MDNYTKNSTNDLIISNASHLNEIELSNFKLQSSAYDMRLSYLDSASKDYSSIFGDFSKSVDNVRAMTDSSNSVSLTNHVNNILTSMYMLEQKQGKLTTEQIDEYRIKSERLLNKYQGKVTNKSLQNIATLPLRNKLAGIQGDRDRFDIQNKLANISSPLRPILNNQQYTQAVDELNDPKYNELGISLYGAEAWERKKSESEEAWFNSLLINTYTKTKADTANLVTSLKDKMSPALYTKITANIGHIIEAQDYINNKLGLGTPTNQDVIEQEKKISAIGLGELERTGGHVKMVDLVGNTDKSNAGKVLKYIGIQFRALEQKGEYDVIDNWIAENPEYFTTFTYVKYGKFDQQNYKSLSGSPLLNSTDDIADLKMQNKSLNVSRDSFAAIYIPKVVSAMSSIGYFRYGISKGGIQGNDYVNLKTFSLTTGADAVVTGINEAGKYFANKEEIDLANNTQFMQWRLDNEDLLVADLLKAKSLGLLDTTKTPDGKYQIGTQQGMLEAEYKRFAKDGSLSDVAKANVSQSFKNTVSKFVVDPKDPVGQAMKSNLTKDIDTNTNLNLITLLNFTYGTKGYTIKNEGGQTYVILENQTYNLNKADETQLLMDNTFDIIKLTSKYK